MFWLVLGIGFLLFLYYILIQPFKYWENRGVPQYNPWLLWIRLFKAFSQTKPVAEGLRDLYSSFPNKRYAGIYQFFKPSVLLRDPELIKQMTVKDFDHFMDHNQFISPGGDPLWEKNLFSLKGEQWREMRATLTPTFTSSKMKAMFGLMCECAEQFVNNFQTQDSGTLTVEMKDVFSKFTNDIIASTAFGVKCDSMNDSENEFYVMGKKAANFVGFRLILLFAAPRLAKFLGIKLFGDNVRSFFKELVVGNMEIREREGIVRPDMIHLLMEAKKGQLKYEKHTEVSEAGFAVVDSPVENEGKHLKQLSDDDITAHVFVFFLAGFETVTASLSFLAYELAINPDVQERLQSEIDNALSECSGTITYDALMRMKYLDMVISESLRKWPPAAAADRVCVKPYTIVPNQDGEKPVHLKKGDVLIIPIYGIHRDPLLYPEPERFDPERFSDENKTNIKHCSYFSFGAGPRSCIGNRFALMEIKIVMFYLLSKFDVVVVDKTAIPLQLGRNPLTLSSKDGFWLGLKARNVQ